MINHCSYIGGRPVMCAGMIGITNGIVGYIDNGSGHYRPTVRHLINCLNALKDQVSPIYFDAILVRNLAGPYKMAVYLAGKFSSTGGKSTGGLLRTGGFRHAPSPGFQGIPESAADSGSS